MLRQSNRVTDFCITSARRLVGMLFLLGFALGAALAGAPAEDYLVQTWATDAGLPDSTVTSIAQTPDGYLWVGTLHGGMARFDGQKFVNFNPNNTPELPSIKIQKLLVDAQGTLWVGTPRGLVSYRNGRFRSQQENAGISSSSSLAEVMSSTSNSVLLATTFSQLLQGSLVNGTYAWKLWTPTNGNSFSAPCCDGQGTVWYRTQSGGLAQFRAGQFTNISNPPGLRGRQIRALLTVAGRLWVGTDSELAVWDGEQFVSQAPANGETELKVLQMAACPDGSLWVRTDRTLLKYRDGHWVAQVTDWNGNPPQRSAFSMQMYGDSRGGVWLMRSGEGLWYVEATGQVTQVRDEQGLPNQLFQCWFQDREGNVWLGLNGGGLVSIRARTFHQVWPGAATRQLAAHSVCEGPEGTMWLSTSDNRLVRWRNGETTNFSLPFQQRTDYQSPIFPAAGSIWVGSASEGVFRLDHEQFSQVVTAGGMSSVQVLYQDRAARLWIGAGHGLFCWESNHLRRIAAAQVFARANVLAIAEDPTGTIWFGTAKGDLIRCRDGTFTAHHPTNTSVAPLVAADPSRSPRQAGGGFSGGEQFAALYADTAGVIWIGSLGGGLLRFAAGNFTRYTPREGLPSDQISQIMEDDHHQLWLGTPAGITRVSKSALNEFAGGKNKVLRFVTYGKLHGLPTVECSRGCQPACWRSPDGHLWFTTVKGPVWTDPALVRSNPPPPPPVIEEVDVDGNRAADPGPAGTSFAAGAPAGLTVSPGRHYLDFKFTSPSLTDPAGLRFQWRLAGLETAWSHESDRRSASFSFVPPGEYDFQVRVRNSDGDWNGQTAMIRLKVQPYFWQTWWFQIAASGAGLLLMLAAGLLIQRRRYRARMQTLERQRGIEQERARIAEDLHDAIGAKLSSISFLSELVRRNLPPEHPASRQITRVTETARGVIRTVAEIVWAVDPKNDSVAGMAFYISRMSGEFFEFTPIELQCLLPSEFPEFSLTASIRHALACAVKEALQNILKHSAATRVEIMVTVAPDFIIRIADNGCGFTPATIAPAAETGPGGRGLRGMRERLHRIGGECRIESTPGAGTRVTFSLPLKQKGVA